MSLDYIRRTYNVPAKRLGPVTVAGVLGVICGARSAHVRIRLDGERRSRSYHPTDPKLVYGAAVQSATCLGCGCTDTSACLEGCWWLVVDRATRQGVCSNCRGAMKAWKNQAAGETS